APVYAEQCDGKPPSTPQWSPSANCDGGTSNAPTYAGADGRVTIDKNDVNRRFVAFVGTSPQGLFSCPPPGSCTVRVSTNNASATPDQVFFAIRLPTPHGAPVATNTNSTPGAGATHDGAAQPAASAGTGNTAAAGTGTNASATGTTNGKGPSS